MLKLKIIDLESSRVTGASSLRHMAGIGASGKSEI
jgi:hypothetical protein